MKKIKIGVLSIALALAIVVTPLVAALNPAPGSQLLFLGSGVREYALGFTGYATLGSLEGASFNPAAIGDLRRLANTLTVGGIGSDNTLISLGLAVPTDSGVFSFSAGFLNGSSADTNTFNNLFSLSIGVSKPITEQLFWGFNIKGYRAGFDKTGWGAGFDMGIIYKSLPDTDFGFGFRDFTWGLTLKNIGLPLNPDDYDEFPGLGVGSGIGFSLIKAKGYTMRILLDGTITVLPLDFSLNAGVEQTLFDMFKIRVGYLVRNKSFGLPQTGAFTFGLGLSGKLTFQEPTDIDISYSFVPQEFNGKKENSHSLNLSVAWGHYDSKKPSVKIAPHVTHFSPNHDGSQDKVRLLLDIKDNTMVDGWIVDVRDAKGKSIRQFKSLDQLEVRSLNVSKFVSRIFSKRRQVEIPGYIYWNGQDEKGNRVKDGTYHIVLKAWDNNKNKASYQGSVVVDTVIPSVVATVKDRIFSPNNDNVKETIAFQLEPRLVSPGDSVSARVVNTKGELIKRYLFKDTVPGQIIWDGKTDTGAAAPEGFYHLLVNASDIAGNKTENRLYGIRLVREYEKAAISASGQAFSPGSRGGNGSVLLKPVASSLADLNRWRIRVLDSAKKVARVFSGTNTLPQEIIWDGKGDGGDYLPDGFYKYRLELFYKSGNHPKSVEQFIEVDRTPATVTIKPQYMEFSPNGDGLKDTIRFTHTVTGHAQDKISLRIIDASGTEYLRKSWQKESFPTVFVWDGLDKNKKPLPEGEYTYILETIDKVANRSRTQLTGIRLKTGLEKVSIQSGVSAFSPGSSKAVAQAVFTPRISAKTSKDITGFEMVIRDSSGKEVRSFRSKTIIPKIIWDGKDDSGKRVEDGRYSYSLKVKYSFGDQPVSVNRAIIVDTKPPVISAGTSDPYFSPNGDGRKETVAITQKAQGDREDRYSAAFLDATGKPVRSYTWKGSVPAGIVWDGKDDAGKPVAEGVYGYLITGEDAAGNRAQAAVRQIKLVRAIPTLRFVSSGKSFSPNGDKNKDSLLFTASVSSSEDLESCELVIYDIARRKVRRFAQEKGGFLKRVVWDGKSDSGAIVGDGIYAGQLVCSYKNGNLVSKEITGIRLDARPPSGSLNVSPVVFTPDGDGENDVLFLNLGLRDFTGVKSWKLAINKRGESRPFRVFSGKGGKRLVKELIRWDGKSGDGQDQVESVEDYVATLDAEDILGNKMPSISRKFTVGVLVEKTPRGLRIRVSSIRFRTGSARLIGNSDSKLNKVIYIIRRILSDPTKYGLSKKAKIIISGHTDDVGPAAYNKKLSLNRARSVRDYFIKKDIDPAILGYEGRGKETPHKIIRPGMSATRIRDYRARNRRVEFFILK